MSLQDCSAHMWQDSGNFCTVAIIDFPIFFPSSIMPSRDCLRHWLGQCVCLDVCCCLTTDHSASLSKSRHLSSQTVHHTATKNQWHNQTHKLQLECSHVLAQTLPRASKVERVEGTLIKYLRSKLIGRVSPFALIINWRFNLTDTYTALRIVSRCFYMTEWFSVSMRSGLQTQNNYCTK